MNQRKQRLNSSNRHTLPVRLETIDHAELVNRAALEMRSMAFIALRRYKIGKSIELAEKQDYPLNS